MNTYTEEDILVLSRLVESLRNSRQVSLGNHAQVIDVLYAHEISLILNGVSKTSPRLPKFIDEFVYKSPLKIVPLYINDPDLKTIARWRLEVGK